MSTVVAKASSSERRARKSSNIKQRVDTPPPQPSKSTDPSFDQGHDFLPFISSDSEDEIPKAGIVASPPRERDAGKRRATHNASDNTNKRQRVDAASRRAPWVLDVEWDKCNNVAEMLHKEVEAFINFLSPTPEEHEIRGLVIQLISRTVSDTFPDAKVLPFGSYETKLYLPLGDIDLVIHSESMAYSNKTDVLHAVANAIRRAGIADKVTIIGKAKVPIVKFVTTHGRFSVDISINQLNGVTAGQMVNRFLQELPALRSLVLVVKSFLSQRSMNEVFTGGLGSYSIVCLCISFLQHHPKIRRGEVDPSKNLGVLVMEFFELYGLHFNYNDVGISVRDGGTYFNKAARGWNDYKNSGLLSIEDPADISNDISRGSYGVARVRQTLAGAHSIMLATAFQRAETIRSRRSGRYASFRGGETTPEEWSILSGVMGITQETINHRRVVQEVFDRRTLHRLLDVEPVAGRHSIPLDVPAKRSKSVALRSQARPLSENSDESDEEKTAGHKRKRREESVEEGEYEEESRYTITKAARGAQLRKRKRTGGDKDKHTVFIADEEDDAGASSSDDDSIADEDEEYALAADALADEEHKELASQQRSGRHQRRSYWLSKGLGKADHDVDSD